MEVQKITYENIDEIKDLYSAFLHKAQEDYLFEINPLPFNDFKENFQNAFIEGYFLKSSEPEAFLLYSTMLSQAIEITLIYADEQEDSYKYKNLLVDKFLSDIKKTYSDKIISYPMLGVQNDYAQDIVHYGFKLVGEMILEFNFFNPITQVILTKADIPAIASPYNIDKWQDVYIDDAAQCLTEEFSLLNDAKFDPRFLSYEGSKEVISNIVNSYYGDFLPQCTTVLKYEHKPIGYCFVNLTSPDIANVPLIFLSKEYKQKGLGAFMLKNSINLLKESISAAKNNVKLLNATCDTDNLPAVKTYRKLGFKEKNYYAHAYQKI